MIYLLLWRDLIIEKEPYAYVLTAVNMGDRPSAQLLLQNFQKWAQKFSKIFSVEVPVF